MFKPAALPSVFLSARDKKHLGLPAWFFLGLLSIAFFLPGIASLPPTDRDESSFAQASKQMIESGNYADIRIQNTPRYKKPIGIYWLQSESVKLFNPDHLNEIWAYRIPSFVSGIIAVLMTAALGQLFFGPAAGLLAAIMMAGCLMLDVEARLAKTDATLLASTLVMQYGLAKAYLKQKKIPYAGFAFWSALGIGILIKGPIILLILFSTLLWLRLSEKNLKWFASLKPWIGIPYVALIILPWLALIGLGTHGQFYQQSAGHDMFGKIWNGEFRGIMPPGLHLLILPVTFFPFSLYALLAAPDVWKNRHLPAIRFCLGWIIPSWIVFEISLTKLPHYVLPVFPAIAILAAKPLCDGYHSLKEHRWRWLPPLALGVWLMVGMGVALAPVLITFLANGTWNIWQITAGLLLLTAQGAAVFFLFYRSPNGIFFLAAAHLLFIACLFTLTLPDIKHLWLSKEIVEMAEAAKPCDKLQIISATYNEPSFIFLAGTETEFTPSGTIAALNLWANPCKLALIDSDHEQYFLDVFQNKSYKPRVIGTVSGIRGSAKNNSVTLTLYTMPRK